MPGRVDVLVLGGRCENKRQSAQGLVGERMLREMVAVEGLALPVLEVKLLSSV